MQQVDLQSQTGRKLAQRRALWFVSILLVLLLVAAAGVTAMLLHSARERIPVTLEYQMTAPAQDRAAVVSLWHSQLLGQVDRLTGMDMFRLFAAEVNDLGDGVAAMIAHERTGQTSPGDSDAAPRLASQIPLMRRSLQSLIAQTDIVTATLVTPSLQPYLISEEPAPDASGDPPAVPRHIRQAILSCLDSGKPAILPAHAAPDRRLRMIMIRPLFAPEYLAAPGSKAVGAIVLACDVTPIVREVTIARNAQRRDQQGWVVQKTEQGLLQLLPDGAISAPLPDLVDQGGRAGWTTSESGDLPIALRTLPDGSDAYALGISLPDLSWLIVQDVSAASVEAGYAAYRSRVVFMVAACTIIAMLLIGMFWWWLVGRRERTVSNTLKQLYQTVNQQHELLRGINSTLADGILLYDTHGVVGYVNDAFAAMMGATPERLIGRAASAVFDKEFTNHVARNLEDVRRKEQSALYNEVLVMKNGRRHYQVACSPFHNEAGKTTGLVSVYRDVTDLVRAQERAQTMLQQTISVFVRAVEAIDPYLRGQSMLTGALASHLAESMRLGEAHVNTVRSAANLSQIGMIQLPRDLVNKSGSLTEQERVELQKHVEYARASLEGIDFGLPVVEAIYEMHERLDGSGYPKRLQGDAITIDARVLAVANTFCALVRPRSYRHAHAVDGALEILSGTPPKYDPDVLHALRTFLQTPTGEAFLRELTEKK